MRGGGGALRNVGGERSVYYIGGGAGGRILKGGKGDNGGYQEFRVGYVRRRDDDKGRVVTASVASRGVGDGAVGFLLGLFRSFSPPLLSTLCRCCEME